MRRQCCLSASTECPWMDCEHGLNQAPDYSRTRPIRGQFKDAGWWCVVRGPIVTSSRSRTGHDCGLCAEVDSSRLWTDRVCGLSVTAVRTRVELFARTVRNVFRLLCKGRVGNRVDDSLDTTRTARDLPLDTSLDASCPPSELLNGLHRLMPGHVPVVTPTIARRFTGVA